MTRLGCSAPILSISLICRRGRERIGLRASGAALTLGKPIALAVHFKNVDMMGEAIEQGAGQPLGAEDAGPFVEWQVAGHDGGAALVTLAEDLEQQFGAGLGRRHIAEFIDDQSRGDRARLRARSGDLVWRAGDRTPPALLRA